MPERTNRALLDAAVGTLAGALIAAQAHAQVPLGARVESILRWTPQQQLERYPAIELLYVTHAAKRGAQISRLAPAERPLQPCIDWQGKPWTLDEYMREHRITGVLVLKDGRVALERYALGRKPEDRWTSFSVAKSITSTLVGAAIADGHIKSLDTPVTTFIRELSGSAYEGVTVRHLITMTSGVKWNEDYVDPNSDVARYVGTRVQPGQSPVIEYMRRLPRESQPGTKFNYKTGETDLAGILVIRATGKPMAQYLSEKIWQPYGMEQDAIWIVDRANDERGGYGISMALRDYARFGQFMLDGARAGGKAVLPAGWIEAATSNQLPQATIADAQRTSYGSSYGYFWWISPEGGYEANGLFGQIIRVYPRERVVIALNSAFLQGMTAENRKVVTTLLSALHEAAG